MFGSGKKEHRRSRTLLSAKYLDDDFTKQRFSHFHNKLFIGRRHYVFANFAVYDGRPNAIDSVDSHLYKQGPIIPVKRAARTAD